MGKMKGNIVFLEAQTAKEFLLPRHYSGRSPVISQAFGWEIDNQLVAVCSFGKPVSNSLCKGIAGDKYSKCVYELNRLCRIDDLELPLSQFVSGCLRRLRCNDWIIVSYADTAMDHIGYIYQACNFFYTGATKKRTDKYTEGNKHSRHYDNQEKNKRVVRTSKHRYVYFCSINKKLKKEWKEALNYPCLPYPKGEIKNYELGTFLEREVINISNKVINKP